VVSRRIMKSSRSMTGEGVRLGVGGYLGGFKEEA